MLEGSLTIQPSLPLRDAFTHYHKRFARAAKALPMRNPALVGERQKILALMAASLRLREAWRPEVEIIGQQEERVYNGYRVQRLAATTWPRCHAPAHLYIPDGAGPKPKPLVLIVCGHGVGGKQATSYRSLAQHLARSGSYALICDNIGQGERHPMGHRSVPAIFGVGLSLQGLIVMETMAWLSWIKRQPRFDQSRLGLAGNSGGGLLSLLTGAFCRDDFAAIASSGYPSTFDFIARKEKQHCHCNLLPGIVGELEMWQLYGAIAPKPLFISQGSNDHFFPEDLFYHVAARVADVYRQAGVPERFRFALYPGGHSWDEPRRTDLTRYFCEQLGLEFHPAAVIEPVADDDPGHCYPDWPQEAATATKIAFRLTGRTHTATALHQVCPPPFTPIGENPALRGDPVDIFSQFELFLK